MARIVFQIYDDEDQLVYSNQMQFVPGYLDTLASHLQRYLIQHDHRIPNPEFDPEQPDSPENRPTLIYSGYDAIAYGIRKMVEDWGRSCIRDAGNTATMQAVQEYNDNINNYAFVPQEE